MRSFDFSEILPSRKIECTTVTRHIEKEVKVVNNFKRGFCKKIKGKIRRFKINDFRSYIDELKVELTNLLSMKKTFYCVLCDIHYQSFIDGHNNMITFDANFCRRLVRDFRDYIKFSNIMLIEYIDMILQYIRCFSTDENEKIFPYQNFLNVYKSDFI